MGGGEAITRTAGRRRPMLLALVYGVFLVLIGLTASALVAVASNHVAAATTNAILSHDRSLVSVFVNDTLRAEDLVPGGADPARVAAIESQLAGLIARDEILRVEIRAPDGTALFASVPGLVGTVTAPTEDVQRALAGEPAATLVEDPDAFEAAAGAIDAASVLRVYLPLIADHGEPVAVVAVWRDAAPVLERIDASRRDLLALTMAAAIILAALLFLIFRAAQVRIARQQVALVESTRRDSLTQLLNHGAVVAQLTEWVEAARTEGRSITIALVDVDNFRLLNDTHGHAAADEVLLDVAERVEEHGGSDALVARYGPDEFLVARQGTGLDEMERAIEDLRRELAELSIQFPESERLPVTVSAGICAFPHHGGSLTEVLSVAALALGEAKAGGGDAVRVAERPERRVGSRSFDVLQGLVIAVDTKDRYTKRHSEDVARYAVFLAQQLTLSDEEQRTIRLAGLLHDVGKIGIPDALLRKPGKLTDDEYEVFKQHVALGDAIVRDVRNVGEVRAGIRNHHERWDGKGYLAGLSGEEIPLIGRILAVADAFSAMTTTRPYRKALPVEEALKRLGDAAGTQLQEELVRAFITGLETADDPPLPGTATVPVIRRQPTVA